MLRKKWQTLVVKAREGDSKALNELLSLFMPLIYKTSSRIYKLCGRSHSIEEIVNNGKQVFRILTLVNYSPQGKAHFPHFIKIYLHARLVQMYRPSALERKTVRLPMFDNCAPIAICPYQELYAKDKERILRKIKIYIGRNFNARERDILRFRGSLSMLSYKYEVSITRITHIKKRCMRKLKRFVDSMGIKKGDI